jgi:hypothetical protein
MTTTEKMYLLGAALTALLLIWGWVAVRVRRRRREADAIAREMGLQTQAEIARRDAATKDHMEHVFGRRALYKREMAQRELDRYYGKRAVGPDPTYEEWAAAKGLPVDEADEGEEVPAG